MATAGGGDSSFSIAIVGGGIAGLTLAIALLQRNIKIDIYEQAPKFGEIGAGVAFGPNAVRAMKKCHEDIYKAFEKVETHNKWASKRKVYFDWVDGYHHQAGSDEEKHLFSMENDIGANSVHRAAFLEELVKLVPTKVCHFGKRLDTITERNDGQMEMVFVDGTSATADAIIACDGIKSRVRQLILGEDSPASYPHYTQKYAYRGLIPMEQAIEKLGEDTAVNAKMHMGFNGHVLTFAVKGGDVLNVVAFRTNSDPWPDHTKLTLPAKKTTALREFEGWGPKVIAIITMLKDDLDCWAIFDTLDHPVTTYCKGRLALSGDAAHATSPHLGSGAGFCCEDSVVMAEILAELAQLIRDGKVERNRGLEAAFRSFEEIRKERTQWLIASSRLTGDLFEWRAEGFGDDISKIKAKLDEIQDTIWNVDIEKMSADAKLVLRKQI